MAQNPIEKVEIVEPPIGELTKRHGGFKRSCFTGCGCIVLFIIGLLVGIRLFVGSGPKAIKDLPENFPKSIPVYDSDNVDSITFISGKYKNRSLEIAGIFPKFILSPLLLKSEETASAKVQKEDTLKRLWRLMTTPVGDSRDTIQIEWGNLHAEPAFVISYYDTELRKQGYTTSEVTTASLSFEKDAITGTLTTEKVAARSNGSTFAILTVNYPVIPETTTTYHAP